MARYFKPPIEFPALNLRVIITGYQYAGDTNDVTFANPEIANPLIKTIIVRGALKVEYPGTDIAATITKKFDSSGLWLPIVWPSSEAVGTIRQITTILEDNTEFACVQPINNYIVNYTNAILSLSENSTINTGVLIFVFGNNYKINDTSYSGFNMFAIQNSSALVTATETCRVITFKADPL